MSKVMQIVPITELLTRIAGEFASKKSIFDVRKFTIDFTMDAESKSKGTKVFNTEIFLPIGPAAGPHTQIAPNLLASYLAGSRVFELKTVQKNDSLEIEKPCIDAFDEGHNTEWSTELSLTDARKEYLRAYILINMFESMFSTKTNAFIFNMSVGYDLAGIKSKTMDDFIEGMRSPYSDPWFSDELKLALNFIESQAFINAFGKDNASKAKTRLQNIKKEPIHSVTLSTMHGCPPEEIQKIGDYLLTEKLFDTAIKLNPTLLGYDKVRAILDTTGFEDIVLNKDGFDHDLQMENALSIIEHLSESAKKAGKNFSIKLSNTLANKNVSTFLPGGERYMSGRALFPITVQLAATLSKTVKAKLVYSFCGGVSAFNTEALLKAGMRTLTVATDILKPGGYARFSQMAELATKALATGVSEYPKAEQLEELAREALNEKPYAKEFKTGKVKLNGKLPEFDCFKAPCEDTCPVSQKVSSYLTYAGKKDFSNARSIILNDNSMPYTTGSICDRKCMASCARLDYEGPVDIRRAKLDIIRTEKTTKDSNTEKIIKSEKAQGIHAVVIGGGPAGLSFAKTLSEHGASVIVHDKEKNLAGVPGNIIPPFRMEADELALDMKKIIDTGINIKLNSNIENLVKEADAKCDVLFLGVGAQDGKTFALNGEGIKTIDALEFLKEIRVNPEHFSFAKHIAVIGGGNTAIDAVRASKKLLNTESASLFYRRTRKEMPCDKEEIVDALHEGVILNELMLPVSMTKGRLCSQVMKLGEKDSSGRRNPIATEKTVEHACDLVVFAIGENPFKKFLNDNDIPVSKNGLIAVANEEGFVKETLGNKKVQIYAGGDAVRGPDSIVRALGDGRIAAKAFLKSKGIDIEEKIVRAKVDIEEKLNQRGFIIPSLATNDENFLANETKRCLSCDSICLRCVETCPNRANTYVTIDNGFKQSMQIIHVDLLCNECGNCGVFCPWDGLPYKDKPTLFSSLEAFKASDNPGFFFTGEKLSPNLTVRSSGGTRTIENKALVSESEKDPMVKLAFTVLNSYSYLLGEKLCK